jgi:hypothetical protein
MKKQRTPTPATQIAKRLAGGPSPAWLEHGLERVVREMLAPAIQVDQNATRRSDLAREVEAVIKASSALSSRLCDRSEAGLLIAGGGPGSAMEDDNELLTLLLGLSVRAENTLSQLKKAGRGKLPGANTPEEICAMIVAVGWHMARGTFPTPSAVEPCEIAEMLWKRAVGPSSTYNYADSSIKRWRPHLRKVLNKGPVSRFELLCSFVWAKMRADTD